MLPTVLISGFHQRYDAYRATTKDLEAAIRDALPLIPIRPENWHQKIQERLNDAVDFRDGQIGAIVKQFLDTGTVGIDDARHDATNVDLARLYDMLVKNIESWKTLAELAQKVKLTTTLSEVFAGFFKSLAEMAADFYEIIRALLKAGKKAADTIADAPGWMLALGGLALGGLTIAILKDKL